MTTIEISILAAAASANMVISIMASTSLAFSAVWSPLTAKTASTTMLMLLAMAPTSAQNISPVWLVPMASSQMEPCAKIALSIYLVA